MGRDVAVFVGSLRREAFGRKLALALATLAPVSLRSAIVEIGHLPLYNQEDDDTGTPPAACTAFRRRVWTADAVLFVTPEDNRSVPGALKNALEVGLRPYGQSAWDGSPQRW